MKKLLLFFLSLINTTSLMLTGYGMESNTPQPDAQPAVVVATEKVDGAVQFTTTNPKNQENIVVTVPINPIQVQSAPIAVVTTNAKPKSLFGLIAQKIKTYAHSFEQKWQSYSRLKKTVIILGVLTVWVVMFVIVILAITGAVYCILNYLKICESLFCWFTEFGCWLKDFYERLMRKAIKLPDTDLFKKVFCFFSNRYQAQGYVFGAEKEQEKEPIINADENIIYDNESMFDWRKKEEKFSNEEKEKLNTLLDKDKVGIQVNDDQIIYDNNPNTEDNLNDN